MAKKKTSQETIIAQWKSFAQTEAYKDYMMYLDDLQAMLQQYADDMVEPRPSGTPGLPNKEPISIEKAMMFTQRKVGLKLSQEFIKLRVDSE